ncbi:MAG: ATP-binding cassette domain-containing protein [Candidatus Pacebacteria bacterium]|nr:ATP-binding cassette domain-containing protein [Candidatus Paceibacterota bacterium]
MANSDKGIILRGVSKRFGDKAVLDGVDLDIPIGKSTVIVGCSGTGKSVLIKSIMGIFPIDSGQIWFDGAEITSPKQRRSIKDRFKFGMLFQGAALFDSQTVWENVSFGLVNGQGMKRGEAREAAVEYLRQVGLSAETADLLPAQLSGGMQKRVGLARAIATRPDYLFFDEPTTGLDPIMSDVINDLIRSTVTSMGVTAVSITHDMASVRKIADTVAMLHQGKIVWSGSVKQIDSSTNSYISQFVNGRAQGPINTDV